MNGAHFLLGPDALARHGARIAILCGSEALGYAELAANVARAAGALRSLGVAPGERVLLLMRDTPEFAAAWLGALHAGAVAVALNNKLSEDEYRYILADSEARLAIVEDVFVAARPDLAAELARSGRLAVAGANAPDEQRSWRRALAEATPLAGAYAVRADDPAFWLYSSGTTGKPKGIIHAHRAVLPVGLVLRETLKLQPGDRVLATSKLFFSYSMEHGLLGPLALGATAILHPDWAETEAVLELAARHRPAAFFSVPTFYRRLLALGAERLAPFREVPWMVSAGEKLPAAMIEQWRAATGREILSLYGMSETFCVCMITAPGTSNGERNGKPFAGIEARRLTAEGRDAEPQEPAVLWVKHPAIALGYANRPEQTQAQFRDGWFCTNDVFVRDAEGYYCHHGRADELVKIAGQWVQPGELEEAVIGEAGIAEAACVRVTDDEGFERLALFVAAGDGAEEAARAAQRACEAKLPRHKRPKWIRSVAELPRTATGKVQRFRLRELLERELGAKR
jgi:benzoate-CoA ligase